MPRDAIAITDATPNGGVTQPAGTAIAPANGGTIANAGDTARLLIRVTNTNGTQRTVTVKAGVHLRKGIGDLAVIVPATTGDKLLVVESARFKQADGSIWLDYEASMAGIVSVVRMPKGV